MEIIATENRIEALRVVNRMTATALQELNEREYFYNQHAGLLAQLSVFAASKEAQMGVLPIIECSHPFVYFLVAIEEMEAFCRALKLLFTGITGNLEDVFDDVMHFHGLQHVGEKQLRLSIRITGQ